MVSASFSNDSLLNLLFDNDHTLVAYLDLESNFIRVSHAYALADGRDPDYFMGKNYLELYQNDVNKKIFNHVIETGKVYSVKANACNSINSFCSEDSFWDWSLSPVKDEQGAVTAVLLQLVDVTRTVVVESQLDEKTKKELQSYDKELEARTKLLQETVALLQHENSERIKTQALLIQAKEAAENANISKSQFLSRMSHELRTPLNAILGFAQLIKIKEANKIQDSYSDEILLAGKHLLSMISDILDLSLVEEGSFSLSISDILLSKLVNESISLVKHKLDFRNVTIHNLIDDTDKVLISADETRVKEVIVNILTNAVKYNVDNGLISIGYKKSKNNQVSIYVTDTGKGLSKEEQLNVFEPFNRLGAEYSDIEGVGIGLTISKKLMEVMGGDISIESEKGRGTTFYLNCPAGKNIEENVNECKSVSLVNTDSFFRILYIEDNKSNQKLVENLFSEYPNIYLDVSPTAEDGLKLIETDKFDLIILDIHLPGMDGYSALEKIKRDFVTKDIPVIALSAAASADNIKKGLDAGFNKYITKPVVLTDLVSIVNSELNNLR